MKRTYFYIVFVVFGSTPLFSMEGPAVPLNPKVAALHYIARTPQEKALGINQQADESNLIKPDNLQSSLSSEERISLVLRRKTLVEEKWALVKEALEKEELAEKALEAAEKKASRGEEDQLEVKKEIEKAKKCLTDLRLSSSPKNIRRTKISDLVPTKEKEEREERARRNTISG